MSLEELKARLDGMSRAKLRFVAQMVEALDRSPKATIKRRCTWITGSDAWLEHFGLALSVHHGATTEPLRLESFETVFRAACETAGWRVDPPGSATQRFVDLVVDNGAGPRRLSLKSTAARGLRERTAHISKLTEAAWIQDVRTVAARRAKLQGLFKDYVGAVDAIVMLRAFRSAGAVPHRYQLIEIPSLIFDSIQSLPPADFRSDAPVLDCSVAGEVAAQVAVDRSDAKITIRNIRLAACVVHAEWLCEELGQ